MNQPAPKAFLLMPTSCVKAEAPVPWPSWPAASSPLGLLPLGAHRARVDNDTLRRDAGAAGCQLPCVSLHGLN